MTGRTNGGGYLFESRCSRAVAEAGLFFLPAQWTFRPPPPFRQEGSERYYIVLSLRVLLLTAGSYCNGESIGDAATSGFAHWTEKPQEKMEIRLGKCKLKRSIMLNGNFRAEDLRSTALLFVVVSTREIYLGVNFSRSNRRRSEIAWADEMRKKY